jgi:alpha-beta hydrolase superfamily lysophospholipase
MHSVAFGEHFGWLHDPGPQLDGRERPGIVLCSPLGHEALWLHQSMRSLADRLSRQGFAVLRFDYAGTGDSADTGELVDPGKWVDEAAQAVDFLRRSIGIQRIALVGFRFGATIAVQAARATGADAVALIAPVVAGRQFVREMKVLQQTWLEKTGPHVCSSATPLDAFDVLGHRFSRTAIDAMAKCDLRRDTTLPAPRILIAHTDNQGPSHELADRYGALGARVDSFPFNEYAATMQPSWLSSIPVATLSAVERWFVGSDTTSDTPASPPAGSLIVAANAFYSEPLIRVGSAVETPVELGDGRLFGVLCEPEDGRGRSPIIVIANTAATHHVGDGRFNVELARRLARIGIASVRVDAHGLGDSRGAQTVADASGLSYDELAADISLAVDWAIARGHPRAAVFGICSGAYLGLRAATMNSAVSALMLINLPGFDFSPGFKMRDAAKIGAGSTRSHFRAMFRARKWLQVLQGELSMRPVLRTLSRYVVDSIVSTALAWVGDAVGTLAVKGSRVRRRMKDLDARGVRVQLLFSPLDHGLDELKMHFGRGGRRLNKLRHASALIVQNMDHEVLNSAARQRVAELCETFLAQAFSCTSNPQDAPLVHLADVALSSSASALQPLSNAARDTALSNPLSPVSGGNAA